MRRGTRAWIALAALAAALGLASCLLDRPLARPGEAYDARADLRGDSLTRFDTVEVWLQDAEDPGRRRLLFKGPLASPESLGVRLGGGRPQVYAIYGYQRGKAGPCFEARHARDGALTLLRDSCGSTLPPGIPPVDPPSPDPSTPGPDDPPHRDPDSPAVAAPPRFDRDTLILSDSAERWAAVLGLGASGARLRPDSAWLRAAWQASGSGEAAEPGRDSVARVRAAIEHLEAGTWSASVILESGGKAVDTLRVRLAVARRFVRGRVQDWGPGRPQAGIRVALEDGPIGYTDGEGTFAIEVGPHPDRHIARLSAPGRIGALDTFALAGDSGRGPAIMIPPEASFRPIDLETQRPLGAVAAAAGYAIAISTPMNEPGSAYLVRLDGADPVLENTIALGNGNGDPQVTEYFEAGEMTADSDAIFVTYPYENRIGRVGNWRRNPESRTIAAPIQPGGLMLDGDRLLCLGRSGDGTLALARFRAADLALLGVDTLSGYAWDGALPLLRCPKLARGPEGYYAVDRNPPNVDGHLLRLDKATGKVTAARAVPDGALDDLALLGDRVYVASAAPGARWIRGYGPDLLPADSIPVAGPSGRLAADARGRFGRYAFALGAADTLLAFAPDAGPPLGRLSVPGAVQVRWIALDGPSRTVLISDKNKLYSARF